MHPIDISQCLITTSATYQQPPALSLNLRTSTAENIPARGRYSPFMFSGINLSTGGHSQEYGEALSAVLPLETKDNSQINKVGISPSTVGIGGGGNHAFRNASLALNLDYQNLALFNKVYPGRIDFKKPYQMFSPKQNRYRLLSV